MDKVLRFAACGLGVALTFGVVAMAVGEGKHTGLPNPLAQPVPVQLDFAGLGMSMLGSLVALKWGRIGGAMMIAGCAMFEGVEWAVHHKAVPIILVFALVGLLHLIADAVDKPGEKSRMQAAK